MTLVTAQPISAVVAHIMAEKQGEYGPYQSVLFESPNLADGKLWRAMKPAEAQQLSRGQAVELTPTKTKKGKDSWNIRILNALPKSSVPQVPQPSNTRTTPEPQRPAQPSYQEQTTQNRREQIEQFIFSMASLHAVCYQAAEQAYSGQDVPDEVVRAATSSLFISAERRFRLCSPGA